VSGNAEPASRSPIIIGYLAGNGWGGEGNAPDTIAYLSVETQARPVEFLRCQMPTVDSLTSAFHGWTLAGQLTHKTVSLILRSIQQAPDCILVNDRSLLVESHATDLPLDFVDLQSADGTVLGAAALRVKSLVKWDLLEPFARIQAICRELDSQAG
jgi:hypothetical protein